MQNVSQEQWICSVLASSFLKAFSKCKLDTKPTGSEILEHMLIAEIWDGCSEWEVVSQTCINVSSEDLYR